jgi:SAM-dependent methyltransferase
MKETLRKVLRRVRSVVLKGNRFYCPVCGKSFRKFYPFGVNPRPNACCPNCGSLERHRFFWVALRTLQKKGLIKQGGRLLHVAPETCLAEEFRKEYDYLSIDLDGKKAMMAMDITAMNFADETFDAVICNHVLEHIPNDRKAMQELNRVLKPGGWASIQVPIKGDITQEDLSITDPKERLHLYGQEDHVRYYGRDFADRLEEAGFEVILIPKSDLLRHDELERISVACESEVILCTK